MSENGVVDLRHNIRLQSLQLQVSDHPLRTLRSNISVSWLVDLLATVQSFEYLELLRISFGIDTDRLRRLSQSDADYWRHLDRILCPKRYHRLSSVQIGIKFRCRDDLGYLEEAQECLTNLCTAGILDLYIERRRFCCFDYC